MRRLLLLVWCFVLVGCGDAASRQLAADTMKTVDAFKTDVDNKIQAEKAFYSTQEANVEDRLFGCPDCTPKIPAEESLYYNDLVVTQQREAVLLADKLINSGDKTIVTDAITYVDNGVRYEADLRTSLLTRQAKLHTDLTQGLVKIQDQSNNLEIVRSQMLSLSTEPGSTEQLKALYELGKGVRDEIQSGKTQKK